MEICRVIPQTEPAFPSRTAVSLINLLRSGIAGLKFPEMPASAVASARNAGVVAPHCGELSGQLTASFC